MSKMLITGASGQLGQLVIDFLIQKGASDDIIALVRSDEQAASFAEKGIATRFGDYDKPETLSAAFEGDRSTFVDFILKPAITFPAT